MYKEEKELVSALLDLREASTDLKDTLLAIERCLKTGKVPKEDIQIILEMLPESPLSEQPLHYLPEREAMVAELQNPEGVDEEVLISFRDYFEATQDAYSKEYCTILRDLAELREKRDLADMNVWWKQCTTEERNLAFAAIAKATGAKKPAKLLAGKNRLMLLARGMYAIQMTYEEAKRQQCRYQALSLENKAQVKKSIQTFSGMDPNQWWNSVDTTERSEALKQLIDVLESSKYGASHGEKTKTSVA